MPLSELLYRMSKGKLDSSQEKNPACSSNLSFVPENDFVELLWENGQIHSSRARKTQTCNLPSQIPKARDKDIGNGTNTKMAKFGTTESVLNEIPMPVPSVEVGVNQDDDMVTWLSYPIDESLQHDYSSEILPEFSGVTVNEHSFQSISPFYKRSSGNQSIRASYAVSVHNGLSLEQGNLPEVSSAADGDATRPRTSTSHLYPSPSEQCQTSIPYFRSRVSANNDDCISNATNHAVPGDSIGAGFPTGKMQKQVSVPSTANSSLMNFSHFTRPAALVRANLQNIGVRTSPGVASLERMRSKDKGLIASRSNPVESTVIDLCTGLQKEKSPNLCPIMVSKVDAKPLEAKAAEESVPAGLPEAMTQEDESKNDKNCHQDFGESADKGVADVERTMEPVVACSSVCSGNSVERLSDDPTQNLKRKYRDTEESEGPSEDVEEESVGAKKAAPGRGGTSSKRSRAAEVHNLSERRRRDRINEKMRALQELIPNCNKVDKASMLDEAIEYLKTLQLQVQIMSMGAGLYMPSMMLPPGMPHMHAGHMAQFFPMGVGMGMGMGMGFGIGVHEMNGGTSSCSMYQGPPMHGAHFPGPPMSGSGALHGIGGSNLQMFGLSGQGLPMPFAHPPLMPMSGGPLLKTNVELSASGVVGPRDNLDSAPASCSKDSIQNVNSQVMQNNCANSSMNQTSSQCQATNECFEQSALMKNNDQAAEVTENGVLKSAIGNDDVPSRATGPD